MGCVAEFADSITDARPICGTDQQIEVAGLPQGNVSVEQFRQGQSFVRHDLEAEFAQVVDDANQLARQKQGFVQVDLMTLFEPRCLRGGDSVLTLNQHLIEKRLNAVATSEIEKRLPRDRLA